MAFPAGSFWLNIGDAYQRKSLAGIPWRVALAMTDRQRWVLRNSVIWNKVCTFRDFPTMSHDGSSLGVPSSARR